MRKGTRKAHGYSVYKRANDGRWGWAVTVGYKPNGNPDRRQGVCKTEKDAVARALEVLAKYKSGAHIDEGKDKKLSDYLTGWLDLYVKPHKEPKTVSYYEGMIRNHITPTLGGVRLRKLTAAQVQKVINDKAKPFTITRKNGDEVVTKLSTETLRGILATLRTALTRAYKDGLVAENVAKRVDLPKTQKKPAQHLTAEQGQALLAACEDHPVDRCIRVALHTGMRIGEVTGLTWQDVNFKDKTVSVSEQLQRVEGKLIRKSLKSHRSRRILPMVADVRSTLEAQKGYQVLQRSEQISPTETLDLVFLNPEGRPLDAKYVNNRLKALLVKAELPAMSFHKLRHTTATLMVANGVPLQTVRDLLGHSQIALTGNTYAHAIPNSLRPASEALENLLKEPHERS